MNRNIKEIRETTGLSQKQFADMYGIPVSTIHNWEQGVNSPPPYVIGLIARTLPSMNDTLEILYGRNGRCYYHDKNQHCLMDINGNRVYIKDDLTEIKEQNLKLYIDDLFDSLYSARDRFDRDCEYDKKEDILWS